MKATDTIEEDGAADDAANIARDGAAPPSSFYERLAEASPSERRTLVLQLIEAHPEGRLVLPEREGGERASLEDVNLRASELRAQRHATLEAPPWWSDDLDAPTLREADLRGASLHGAHLEGVDLRGADLRGASLGDATLRGARLGNADLRGADLADADLEDANLGETLFEGALLEQTNLRGASLRFAELQDCALDGADLHGADLWGVHLEGAILVEADLREAQLREAHLRGADLTEADLREADLRTAHLTETVLRGADLRGARVTGASFRGAVLQRAHLEAMVLTECDVAHIHVGDAWLDKTRLRRGQLGGAVGEEIAGDYEAAHTSYLTLEKNFEALGNPDAARWAYLRRRRMGKYQARKEARRALGKGHGGRAAQRIAEATRLQFIELLCDYGESINRTLAALFGLYALFTVLYGLTGSVVREGVQGTVALWPLGDLIDLMTFSIITMTSPEGPQVALHPSGDAAHFLTGTQTLLTVVLGGLLGFVLGNRIHRR